MVCPRCIGTVQDILTQLNIEYGLIELGKVEVFNEKLDFNSLQVELQSKGFELLENSASKTINKIKSIIIQNLHYSGEVLKVNYSTLLSDEIGQEYSSLSKLFSSVEGITIEKFIVKQKIEKVKELLVYNELSLKEIAFKLKYSSVAHLSNQFKKETGMTPTQFQKLNNHNRYSLDSF
jgi:AraC family transcriptional regulator